MNDTFLIENTVWRVTLSNEEEIISDNKYIDDKSDWERLRDYCMENELNISKMSISFRDNHKQIPKAKYYYFRRMALGSFGKTGRRSDTYEYFLVGSTDDPTKVHIQKYLTPELQCLEEEDRDLEPNEISLI